MRQTAKQKQDRANLHKMLDLYLDAALTNVNEKKKREAGKPHYDIGTLARNSTYWHRVFDKALEVIFN